MGNNLEKLMLIVKQSLKLLNTLGLSFKDKIVLLARQRYKIFRSVIAFNPIKMMNYPSFRQYLIIGLLPYNNMFLNIPTLIGMWVVGLINIDITMRVFVSPPLPIRIIFAPSIGENIPKSPSLPIKFITAGFASLRPSITRFATIKTGMSMLQPRVSTIFKALFIGWVFRSHVHIISPCYFENQAVWNGKEFVECKAKA